MNRVRVSWILALISLVATPAHAAWSIGANLGIAVLEPRGEGSSLTALSLPGSTGPVVPAMMPGLRIGATTGDKDVEFYIDSGLDRISSSGSSLTSLEATANLQYNLSRDSTTPYLTAGIGFINLHGEEESSSASGTNAVIGAGLGLRRRVKHGFGTFRGEARVDTITEDRDQFGGGTLISLKFGFDLWMD